MKYCWAISEGGCSGTQSREHIISRAAIRDTSIDVQGVQWLSGKAATVNPARLTARILCTKHNSQLSSLDSAAARLSHAIRDLPTSTEEEHLTVNGWQFERWCLKVLLNLCASGWTEITRPTHTPELVELVEITFGKRPFEGGRGLYIVKNQRSVGPNLDHFRWNILLDTESMHKVLGLVLSFQRMLLVLSICGGNPESSLRKIGKTQICDFTDIELIHRPKRISLSIPKSPSSLVITLEWPPNHDMK